MPTLQETFDRVISHLRKQGKKSFGNFPSAVSKASTAGCMYRGPEGLMCAAGCLIPDDKYSPEFEGCSVSQHGPNSVCDLMRELGHDLGLVQQLQFVHDKHGVEEWEDRFQRVAALFKLNCTSPIAKEKEEPCSK